MTDYPTEQIVAPTTRDEVLRFLDEHDVDAMGDAVDFQDRLFFIRQIDGADRPELPRAAADVATLATADGSAHWHVVRADFPMDAWVRIRDHDEEEPAEARGTEIVDELVGDVASRAYAVGLLPSTA